ncbi:MAG: hypothetical protein ACK5JO_12960, partial [Halodesulfovibrio sp.]
MMNIFHRQKRTGFGQMALLRTICPAQVVEKRKSPEVVSGLSSCKYGGICEFGTLQKNEPYSPQGHHGV